MNTEDINLAYKVRHALDANLDNLPVSTVERLASARKMAVSRKKAHAPAQVAQRALAGNFGSFFSFSSLGRAGAIIPLLALVAGLAGVYQYEQQQRIAELAELDAAVLSDELPLTAYLDHGFNAYLAQRGQ
ncbi:hypothetical protein CR105_14750 [Massilia eurypsychrophila]|jgi:hypothetical protein|uniref:DUF3619 domain-containing protein n=1 Tax=Massilia eurypsychrophila TaxID=1485217 RepID=A0A2G8TEA7_9BURK|nr:DUF3619 family protein [Massilia eurypsychrophila]PIL44324.1 hypothetical protein CR105_14750 [Massilia eurypsychrophila]